MNDLIHAHCAWLRAGGRSSRTVEAREYWLTRADNELPYGVVDANVGELTTWLGDKKKNVADDDGWAPATRAKVFYHLNEFYLWGVDPRHAVDPGEPILEDNPMVGMIRPRAPRGEPRPVTDRELEIVLTQSREPHLTEAVLAYGAGLRATELSMILREEITEEDVWVRYAKGRRKASVPTTDIVWEHVRDFPRGRVVEHVGGVADGRKTSHRAAVYFSRTLKLPGVCLHRLRHTFAAHLRRGGADIATIQRALRHRDIGSTQIYAQASEAECRLAVQALRPSTTTRKQKP